MSTSIYKPLGLSFLGNTPDRRIFCRSEVRKVKRVLFEPVDHAVTQKFIDEELQKITVTESKRWNFDFKTEKTIDPDGIYNWRPATPQKNIRPIKRPCTPDIDVDDLYGRPTEVEITKPIPQRPLQDQEMKSPPKSSVKLQRPITEFMPVKKKTTCEFSKKSIDRTPSSMERPSKLPRLSEYSS